MFLYGEVCVIGLSSLPWKRWRLPAFLTFSASVFLGVSESKGPAPTVVSQSLVNPGSPEGVAGLSSQVGLDESLAISSKPSFLFIVGQRG